MGIVLFQKEAKEKEFCFRYKKYITNKRKVNLATTL